MADIIRPQLIILRGPSGSGKSTRARELLAGIKCFGLFFEADDFFINSITKKYEFDGKQLANAHRYCQEKVEYYMVAQTHDNIIVSNTAMAKWELEPYIKLSNKYGWDLIVLKAPQPWDAEELAKRNIHGVPLETIKKQIARFEPFPGETEWTEISEI